MSASESESERESAAKSATEVKSSSAMWRSSTSSSAALKSSTATDKSGALHSQDQIASRPPLRRVSAIVSVSRDWFLHLQERESLLETSASFPICPSSSNSVLFFMAPSVMGSPIAPFLDLSMESPCFTTANIRRALDLLGDGKTPVTLDPPTEQQLLPFESMFQFQRIKSPLSFGHLLLLLYSPIGLLLLVFRGFCCFLVALVLPRVFTEEQIDRMHLAKLFVWLTGTRVVLVDEHLFLNEEDRAEIIVANHISEFDAVAMLAITPAYILGYDFYKKMLFFKLLGDKAGLVYVPYVSRQQGNGAGRDAVRQIIVDRLEQGNKPLAAFPEGGLTNGRRGLLQYHKFLFSLGKTVQPLAIRASDGPFPVNINDETSTFLANVLWYLFVPWHTYTVQFLPCTKAAPDEDPLIVAQRVMKSTAEALQQQASPFMYRDKIAFTRYKTQQLKKNKK